MEIGISDGTERTFVIATIHGPRQRRHLHAAVGRPVKKNRPHSVYNGANSCLGIDAIISVSFEIKPLTEPNLLRIYQPFVAKW